MNLSSIDLNLLVAFETLFETRSVTLAGQRLNRAQPSVSNALSRLRSLFGDALFVRTSDGMMPTERAMALMPAISLALEQIRQAMHQAIGFDPADAQGRRFTIAASDYADVVIIPHLVALLRRHAPAADLRVTALDRAAVYEQLDQAAVDLVIGGHLTPPKRMLVETLYEEHFVCIADRRNALLRKQAENLALPLQTYLNLPHALFVPSDDGSTRGAVDTQLDKLRQRRRVAATFAHIVGVPYAVAGTDMIATLAARAVARLAPKSVATWLPPAELGNTAFNIDMVYGRRTQGDAAMIWLRKMMMQAVLKMNTKP